MGAGVLVLMGWRQLREPEEQAEDAEIGDQRPLCISWDSQFYALGFMKQTGKRHFRNIGKGKFKTQDKDWSFPSLCY